MGWLKDQVSRKAIEQFGPEAGAQWIADMEAANRGSFGNTVKRIGQAAPIVFGAPLSAGLMPGAAALGGVAAGALKKLPGVSAITDKLSDLGGAIKNIPGLDKLKGLLPGNLEDVLKLGTGAMAGWDEYKGRRMRGDALQRLGNVQPRDLSDVFASDSPYSRPGMRRLSAPAPAAVPIKPPKRVP